MDFVSTDLDFGALSVRTGTNRIIVHHAEALRCSAEDIHRWHKGNGWSGAGYHFLVRKDGSIYRLRPEYAVGAHASGANYDSIGICFEGNFMNEDMGYDQISAGAELVAWLKSKYGISKVQRHKDVGDTDCPGTNFPFGSICGGATPTNLSTFPLPNGHWYGMPDRDDRNHSGYYWEEDRPAIKMIQNVVGSYPDGYYGANTNAAVVGWQAKHGLDADGLVGILTWSAMFD